MIEYAVIRNKDRDMIGVLDVFSSILWVKDYYTTGEFEIYTSATPEHIAMLKTGNYVTIPNDEDIGIIESIEADFSIVYGDMITVRGRLAKSILDRRIIYKLNGTQNPAYVLSGNVETAVRKLVSDNIISAADANRNISFIKLGAVSGASEIIVDENGEATRKQTTGANLLTYSDELLQEYKLGAKMILSDGNLLYTVYKGKDRTLENTDGNIPVIFSREFDSLSESLYSRDDTQLKTTAIIGGAGEDLDRFTTLYRGNYTGENRREMYVDARNIQQNYRDENDEEKIYSDTEYRVLLNAEAKTEFAERVIKEGIKGVVDISASKYKFRKDFDVGDLVTVSDKRVGFQQSLRIVKVMETQDENGYTIDVEFE